MTRTIDPGKQMYSWAQDLYPICRSLTGNGVRETLRYIQTIVPELSIKSIKTGTPVFDWEIPQEWDIQEAYIADLNGKKVVDFKNHNFHIVGYSDSIDQIMSFKELDKHLYSLPDQEDAIPYVTSYYKKRWGFCLSHKQRQKLQENPDKKYYVKIDTSFKQGELNYGELIIKGNTSKEILLSTYICHPSMANNELSGPVVATQLAQWIKHTFKNRRYTYRILFLVETIGSIAYLSKNLDEMKKNTEAGFVLTCVGDDRCYSFIESRLGNTLADRVAKHVLTHHTSNYKHYSILDRGSDERQYCSPGIDLPVCSLCRSKYNEYPEYHTSLDNLQLISPEGLEGALVVYQKCIEILERNDYFRCTTLGEPQLGKRGLYPTLSTKDTSKIMRNMLNVIAYSDGNHDLLAIADKIGVNVIELFSIVNQLIQSGVIEPSKQ